MFTRSKIHGFILVGLVLTLGSAAWVQAESDPKDGEIVSFSAPPVNSR